MSYSDFNGTIAEYRKLHKWVRRTFPAPAECDSCKTQTAKRYDWASIDHVYTTLRKDWAFLCRSCHIKEDGRINQLNKGGGENWPGWRHSAEAKAKMSANHWMKRRGWPGRERNERGHFI